jgi:hypothetical protein
MARYWRDALNAWTQIFLPDQDAAWQPQMDAVAQRAADEVARITADFAQEHARGQ